MLFTQFDLYKMKNPDNYKEANYGVYTGIFQFPKRLSDDWNLISRVVWTVPSQPIDQDDIDDFRDFDFGSLPGVGPVPPEGSPPAPIDLFDGRTTGLGDSYYVGLFAPSEGVDIDRLDGKFLWGAGFDLGFPTATDDVLGTGKWLAGPSALGVYMGPKWKVGALLQHYWRATAIAPASICRTSSTSCTTASAKRLRSARRRTSSATGSSRATTSAPFPSDSASTGPSSSEAFPCASVWSSTTT
jgi:hypothetical protein